MEHKQILTEAARVLTERAGEYGAPEECFTRIANIASEMLMRRVSRYEVATILLATKMGRAGESGMKADTWIDAANYASFAAQFSTDPDSPALKNAPKVAPRRPSLMANTSLMQQAEALGVRAVADALTGE